MPLGYMYWCLPEQTLSCRKIGKNKISVANFLCLQNTSKIFHFQMVEISHTFICDNSNIEPMFCKHIIDLQNHRTTRSLYCLEKPNGYMTRSTLVIQKCKLKTKILMLALNVHKSKLTMQEL
jgi:hypothetical protein